MPLRRCLSRQPRQRALPSTRPLRAPLRPAPSRTELTTTATKSRQSRLRQRRLSHAPGLASAHAFPSATRHAMPCLSSMQCSSSTTRLSSVSFRLTANFVIRPR
ncbi:MAG: hypothetical protein AMJ66_10905 [Betaproteobacteria bacterium SG8_40]|nr:MAG: hypothetical protein AMJ66_10905 [Betaproteobacteria bacterium SG8_40]